MQGLDLKGIERKAWTSFWDDGLVDIVAGTFLITPGIRILTDNVWFTAGFFIGLPILLVGKRITASRMGRVRFGPERKRRLITGKKVFGIVLLAILAIWMVTLGGVVDTSVAIRAVVLGGGLLMIWGLIAYFMDLRRLYLYAAFLATCWVLLELDYEPAGPIALVGSGSIALFIGLSMFIRFLRKYPNQVNEGENDNIC